MIHDDVSFPASFFFKRMHMLARHKTTNPFLVLIKKKLLAKRETRTMKLTLLLTILSASLSIHPTTALRGARGQDFDLSEFLLDEESQAERALEDVAGAGALEEEEEAGPITIAFTFNGTIDETYKYPITPDPTVAAGIASLVGLTTLNIELKTKGGNQIDYSDLHTFFQPINEELLLQDYQEIDFHDPKVIYDMFEGRFIVLALWSSSEFSYMFGAVSKFVAPQNLTAVEWSFFSVDVLDQHEAGNQDEDRDQLWAVFPDMVVDEVALYITCGMHIDNSIFAESRLWVMNKYSLYDTSATLQMDGTVGADTTSSVLISATRLVVDGEMNHGPYALGYIAPFSPKADPSFGTYLVSYHSDNRTRVCSWFQDSRSFAGSDRSDGRRSLSFGG